MPENLSSSLLVLAKQAKFAPAAFLAAYGAWAGQYAARFEDGLARVSATWLCIAAMTIGISLIAFSAIKLVRSD
jgi:hypothetical protein